MAYHEDSGREEVVEAVVEVGVLQAVLGDQREDAVQRQNAMQAPRVQSGSQEVSEQVRVCQVGNDVHMHLHQHLCGPHFSHGGCNRRSCNA